MGPIYYDLSEQFLSSGIKFKYYGIARTVMEVGYELSRSSADVRFVVFSPAHDRFFEVEPRIGAASVTGVCDPNLPAEAKPLRLRYSFPEPHRLRDALYPIVSAVVRRIGLRRWRRAVPEGSLREIDLSGQVVVSLGRPKMMADYLMAMDRLGIRMRFYPLLHDMIPLHEFSHPRQSMFARNFAHDNQIVIQHSEKLLTNSVFTKTEVERFSASGSLPALPPVIPVLLPHELRETDEPVCIDLPVTPYFLGVGVMTGRKNLECILQAMLYLHNTGRPVPLFLLAGAHRKRTVSYVDRVEFSPIKGKIQFAQNPNQAELRALYKKALALIIPSHMEGFGLPLGEALWLGTPGLSSDIAALREVGGDLAKYFDPNDPGALASLIDTLHSNPEAHAALKDKIVRSHASLRTWKDVAADIVTAVSQSPAAVQASS
ncbi:glycosyltransferase [Sulfitobacter sp. DFL-23]|nr:glycosyltransferase [Sulfitobacter sp. DFL-23]